MIGLMLNAITASIAFMRATEEIYAAVMAAMSAADAAYSARARAGRLRWDRR